MGKLPRNKHLRAPIFEKLIQHLAVQPVSLHVPGHKNGMGLVSVNEGNDQIDSKVEKAAATHFRNVMRIDMTELSKLDDLHDPHGVIDEAQQLAADCFGAEQTFFLIGGSTVGNLAMITTVCREHDILLVQRNVHKSVLHGLMLAGARAVFIQPMLDEGTGLATSLQLDEIERALSQYPEAKGLLVTNPNYYGLGIDLKPIADLLHARGKLLLVDEAHGAHFGFHPKLPESAIKCGADAVVQSTHKMLSSMTMSAMLHVQGPRMNRDILRQRLQMLQSSSPSYPLMASLDLARRQLAVEGTELLQKGLNAVRLFEKLLAQSSGFQLAAAEANPLSEAYAYRDPFKLILFDATGALTGPQLQQELEQRGCFVEMSDPRYVLLVFSLASTEEDAKRTAGALDDISTCFGLTEKKQMLGRELTSSSFMSLNTVSQPVPFNMSQQLEKTQIVELALAAGEVSAQMVVPYPPGIPVLYPGEFISSDIVTMLQQMNQSGIRFQGESSRQLSQLNVRISR